MKFIVVSDKTIERSIAESQILDNMKSDKERELEKKQKEETKKKEKEDKKKDNNDNIIVKPPENKEKPPETKEKPPETKEKPPETKEKPPETKEKPPETKEKPPETKEKPPETKEKPPEIKEKPPEIKTPPKPTNPSGKIIPKPKKPLMKNSPAAKAGIPTEKRQKIADMNAAFQATKNKNSGYTKMDFIKDFPNSQTAKKYRKGERIPGFKYPKKTKVKADPGPDIKAMSQYSKPSKEVTIDDFKSTPPIKKENIKSSYEPYHIVLGYVLSEGHAETVEEAHYVMTQMDTDTIQEIVSLDEMGPANKIMTGAALTLGAMGLNAIRKQMQNKKKMEQGGKFRPGSTMDNIQKKNEMLKNM